MVRPLRRAAVKLAPADTAHGRWARSTVRKVRRLRYDGSHQPPLDFDQILAENTDRKGIVVYPPFIDWNWMRQRPHQLMAQFAAAGYLSLFCSPKVPLRLRSEASSAWTSGCTCATRSTAVRLPESDRC